ncbi:hypothetical protein [Orrella sp. 11846]|uniref:hypothetical protein n=1 Tax=Orrella sp. 11846 TaxID=3409913 RepID=UPI003B5C75E1
MLLYGDNLDAVPTQTSIGGKVNATHVPADTERWMRPLTTFKTSGDRGCAVGVFEASRCPIPIGSEKALVFFGSEPGKAASICTVSVTTENPTQAHFIGGMFSWKPRSPDIDYPRPIIGWNGGLEVPENTSGLDPLEVWAATALMLVDQHLWVAGQSGNTQIAVETEYHLEMELNPATHRVTIWLNGHKELEDVYVESLDRVDTLGWMLGSVRTSPNTLADCYIVVDDIFVLDGTGDSFNARLGPVRFKRVPLLAQDDITWTPDGAAGNLEAVNKTTLSDATYNVSPAANDKADTFTVDTSGLDPDATILGVMMNTYAAKADVGDRSLDQVVITNGQTARNPFGHHLSSTYNGADPYVLAKAPDDSAWDIDTIDNTVFGYEVKE